MIKLTKRIFWCSLLLAFALLSARHVAADGLPATSNPLDIGVTVDETSAEGVMAAADLGAAWARQVVNWKQIEPAKGTRDYTALDAAVDALSNQRLKVLLTLTNAPDWARSAINEDGPPTDYADFANFAADVAARYKGKVQAYEIWNEPNLRRNWNGKPLSAASYVELLRAAYNAIKGVDNRATVVSAGLAPTGYNDNVNAIDDRLFLKQAYAAGLAGVSDAIGVHPHGWSNPPDSTCCAASPGVQGWYNNRSFFFRDTLTDYRQIMQQNKDAGTALWPTWFGWGSSDGVAPAESVDANRYGFVSAVSQALQAQYMVRALEIGRDSGYVGPMFAASLNGCQVNSDPASSDFVPCFYSLMDASGKPRPAYEAIRALGQ